MDSLNSLIALHEANERLKEIHELKGNLPELLTQKKIELEWVQKYDLPRGVIFILPHGCSCDIKWHGPARVNKHI